MFILGMTNNNRPFQLMGPEDDKKAGEIFLASAEGKAAIAAAVESETTGLKKNNADLIKEKRATQEKLAKFEGFDSEEYNKLKEEQKKADETKKKEAGDFEALKTSMTKSHTEELGKRDVKAEKLTKALEKHLVSDKINTAVVQAKGVPNLIAHAISPFVKVVEADNGDYSTQVVDASGTPRYNGASAAMSVPELVAEFKANEQWGRAFDAGDATGGGAEDDKGKGTNNGKTAKTMKHADYNKLPDKEFSEATKLIRSGSLKLTP